MKWPAHRTSINRTLQLAQKNSAIQTIITTGLLQRRGTVTILQDIIQHQHAEQLQLMDRLERLVELTERKLK